MRERQVRVVIYGVGAMGSQITRLITSKEDIEIVAAIDHDPAKIGRDLGDVVGLSESLNVPIKWEEGETLVNVDADVVLLATTAFAQDALPILKECIANGTNVVTIAQELFFPIGQTIPIARKIHELAKNAGVAITAVGINPGFILDVIPAVCSVACWQIESVTARRNVDFSPYGPDEMTHIGANLTQEEFFQGVENGLVGHIGLLETVAFAAQCCGIAVDTLHQTKEPLLSRIPLHTDFVEIEAGKVRGFRQCVKGIRNGKTVMDFQMLGVLAPWADPQEFDLGDYIRIEGKPNVDIRIKEEISQKGGLGTAAVAVNTLPRILEMPPGFHTMDSLPLPHLWSPGLVEQNQMVITGR